MADIGSTSSSASSSIIPTPAPELPAAATPKDDSEVSPPATLPENAKQKLEEIEKRGGEPKAPVVQVKKAEKPIDTSQLKLVDTLDVGDKWASKKYNPDGSVKKLKTVVPQADSKSIVVEAPPPASKPTVVMPRNIPAATPPPQVALRSTEGMSEMRPSTLREMRPKNRYIAESASSSSYYPVVSEELSPPEPPSFHRYVLDFSNVNQMISSSGHSTPSQVAVLDDDGRVIKTIDLSSGNSQYVADLPPGHYKFRAISGTRGNSKLNDNFDNYQMKIYDGGKTPKSDAQSDDAKDVQAKNSSADKSVADKPPVKS